MAQIKFKKAAGVAYSKWVEAMWQKGFQLSSAKLAETLNISPPTALTYFRSLNYVVYSPENPDQRMAYFKLSDVNDYCNAHATLTAQTRRVMVNKDAIKIANDKLQTVAGGKKSVIALAKQYRAWATAMWSVTGINEQLCWFASGARLGFCARHRGNFKHVNVPIEKYKDFFINGILQRGKYEKAHPEIQRRNWFDEGAIRAEIQSPGKTKSLIIHFFDWSIEENYIILPAIYDDAELKNGKIQDKCNGMIVENGKAAFGRLDI